MRRYLLGRFGAALLVLFALSLLSFGMVRWIPGDPAAQFMSAENPDPGQLAAIRTELGLDRPWYTQYFDWMGGLVQGDFGQSLTKSIGINGQLGDRLPVSLQLAAMAIVIALAVGVPLGVWAALRPGGLADVVIRGASFMALSVPAFILAALVILANSQTVRARVIGFVPFAEDPAMNLRLMALPALLLALSVGAVFARYTRGTVIDALEQDYVRTARAKGASLGRIVTRHALRNALIPVATVVGIQLAVLIGGTIVIESVFALPGMGSLLIEAINTSDYPTIQACVLVIGLTYVVINLLVDLLYPLIDPRVRVVA